VLRAAAASGRAPSGALALPRAGARALVAARAGGGGAGVAAPEQPRPRRAEGQPLPSALPSATRAIEATPRDRAGRVQSPLEGSGRGGAVRGPDTPRLFEILHT
jgi:hypothetical protein